MKGHILVAIDGSKNSHQALEEAIKLAEVLHSKIFVVNVQPSFHTIHTRLFIKEETIKEYQLELFDIATSFAIEFLQAQNIDHEIILKVGDPIQQICHLAKELNVQYILMGSRGMGLVKGTVLGSISYGVLHATQIPIIIIPQRK